MPPPRASTAAPDAALVDQWLADGAGMVPCDELLAYAPTDAASAERYCLALYQQMGVPARAQAEFDALWARSARLDPERRLLKAVYDLSLLDVCYEALRHANLFGRWVRPRPRLARMIDESRCLRAFYDESARTSRSTTFATWPQHLNDLVRNLLLMAFLFWTFGVPTTLLPTLTSMPESGTVFVPVAVIAATLSVLVSVTRTLLRLPRSPTLLVTDPYSAAVLRSGPWALLTRSIVSDLIDEVLHRWMGVSALAFLLSLLDLSMTHYVGSLVMIAALVGVVSERCSFRAILIMAGLSSLTVYGQIFNISLLWSLGNLLRSTVGKVLLPLSLLPPESVLDGRPDYLTALVLSPIRLPKMLTLAPWPFGDFFLEPCQMILSSLFWNIALSNGFMAALIGRFVFSFVTGLLLFLFQGPISIEFIGKTHEE